jgi:hypothetical protein
MVALCGQRDAAQALTFHAQRVTLEQAVTHRLQLPASDALRGLWLLCPGFAWMLAATARAITYKCTAAGMAAWSRG